MLACLGCRAFDVMVQTLYPGCGFCCVGGDMNDQVPPLKFHTHSPIMSEGLVAVRTDGDYTYFSVDKL